MSKRASSILTAGGSSGQSWTDRGGGDVSPHPSETNPGVADAIHRVASFSSVASDSGASAGALTSLAYPLLTAYSHLPLPQVATGAGSITASNLGLPKRKIRHFVLPIPPQEEHVHSAVKRHIQKRKRLELASRAAQRAGSTSEDGDEALQEARQVAEAAHAELQEAESVVTGAKKKLDALMEKREAALQVVRDDYEKQQLPRQLATLEARFQTQRDQLNEKYDADINKLSIEKDLAISAMSSSSAPTALEEEDDTSGARDTSKKRRLDKEGETTGDAPMSSTDVDNAKSDVNLDSALPPTKKAKTDEKTTSAKSMEGVEKTVEQKDGTKLGAVETGESTQSESDPNISRLQEEQDDKKGQSCADPMESIAASTDSITKALVLDEGKAKDKPAVIENSINNYEIPKPKEMSLSEQKAGDLKKIKSDVDELNKTKSQMVWLLKQVITAENKRKISAKKKKEDLQTEQKKHPWRPDQARA